MSSAFDGRATAAVRKGAPIKLVWDGTWLTYSYAAILKIPRMRKSCSHVPESRAYCGRIYSRHRLSRAKYASAISRSRVDPAAKYRSEKRFEGHPQGQRLARRQAARWQNKCRLCSGALAGVAGAMSSVAISGSIRQKSGRAELAQGWSEPQRDREESAERAAAAISSLCLFR